MAQDNLIDLPLSPLILMAYKMMLHCSQSHYFSFHESQCGGCILSLPGVILLSSLMLYLVSAVTVRYRRHSKHLHSHRPLVWFYLGC